VTRSLVPISRLSCDRGCGTSPKLTGKRIRDSIEHSADLASRAFWYMGLRALFVAVLALGVGKLFEFGANSGHSSCHGALCGTITGSHIAGFIYVFAAFLQSALW
jgi:hypothetical protein